MQRSPLTPSFSVHANQPIPPTRSVRPLKKRQAETPPHSSPRQETTPATNKNTHMSTQCYMCYVPSRWKRGGGRGRVSSHTPPLSLLDGNPVPAALSASGARGRASCDPPLILTRVSLPPPHMSLCAALGRSAVASTTTAVVLPSIPVHRNH